MDFIASGLTLALVTAVCGVAWLWLLPTLGLLAATLVVGLVWAVIAAVLDPAFRLR